MPTPWTALRLAPAGPLTLSTDSFPRRLYVRSLSPETLSVAVRFYESEPDTASAAVRVSPDRLLLPPGASAPITLHLQLARLRRLPYSGYVYASARGRTGEALEVSVVRRVRPPPIGFGGRVARWSTELRRHALLAAGCDRPGLFGTCTRRGVLPLASREDGEAAVPPEGVVLGYLSDSAGRGTARVSSAGAARVYGSGGGVRLAFTGLDRVGRYTGEIVAGGADGSGTVSLTVLVGHGMLFPVLAILAGIALAWPLESYTRRERAHRLFRAGLRALGDDHAWARAELEARLAGVPTRYSVGVSAAELQGEFRRRYEAHAGQGRAWMDGRTLRALLAELAAVRGRLRRLPALGTEVVRLATALDAFSTRDELRPPGVRRSRPPAFLEAARRTLGGRPLVPEEIPAAIREVAAAALAVRIWCRLNRAAREAWDLADRNGDPVGPGSVPPAARERIEEARRRVLRLWAQLWDERFDPADWAYRLDAAEGEIRALRGIPERGEPAARAVVEERARDGAVERALLPIHERDAGQEGGVARRAGRPQRFVSGLVLVAAVLLALDRLYFATPAFGTPRDYVTAFLWGFGAKAAVEALKTLGALLMSESSLLGSGS